MTNIDEGVCRTAPATPGLLKRILLVVEGVYGGKTGGGLRENRGRGDLE